MDLILYLLGATFMFMYSMDRTPNIETYLHFISAVVWPLLVIVSVYKRILN